MFISKKKTAFYRQYDAMDCGSTCLKIIASHYGKEYPLDFLREISFIGREGVSLLNLSYAAEKIGFKSLRAKLTINALIKDCPLPCILHWNQNHFVVLYSVRKSINGKVKSFKIGDPAHGMLTVDKEEFCRRWLTTAHNEGVALLLDTTPEFYKRNDENKSRKSASDYIYRYLKPHYRYIFQFLVGMLASSGISLMFPFLTQALIDHGVGDKNIKYVYLILFSQLFLFFGMFAIQMVQSWLMLHINIRISLNIISDFLIKLLNLPIKYFDTKTVGDISQRLNDHHRIEDFLTGVTLNTVLSIINIVVYSVVLMFYSTSIIIIFWGFTLLALGWIFIFQKKRKNIDYKRFRLNKDNQDKLTELIYGMQEIKLYGAERSKRWEWEHLQIKSFKLNMKSLTIEQYQKFGYVFLTQIKNIIITFIAAGAVIQGELSLGMLLSISYIIGQTNGPIEQLVAFIKSAQDASLSINRMNEIHAQKNEVAENIDNGGENSARETDYSQQDIEVANVSFQYEGPKSPMILKNINLIIRQGSITAIVGASGSGKTTLMKLLLGYYTPSNGKIYVGNVELKNIEPAEWRNRCGTIMQEGYIFSDTIARNIALGRDDIDHERMRMAVHTANIEEFIKGKPLGYTTKIGNNGVGVSGGQKQRIFIARAVYKNPAYIFLDEATSSLDANNEKEIMEKLDVFFEDKTVVIIAHRLSTVKNADQIIVLDNGEIVERGNHRELIRMKGVYFKLIRNQLELGE
ncbi:peptidase domain-containing ABC transporter [Chitinophaga sancti]|uniref:peptidase domain-containing ABC transporter n=1 Tax=Chitinophaga sancti TaxID=1004 RepID=UPI003F791FE0